MELEFSDGSTMELEYNDSRTIFDEPVETSFIKIKILEVESGTKYQNTCVSELKAL
ncbi:hypothetical protein [Paenibacillus durus]|uniref:hypothetical protein n=1 Tax=Paenibacillus durus TaxID=44251 RepID=UPI0004ACB043|nr:hypothetical protein [Paenibacillus durus]